MDGGLDSNALTQQGLQLTGGMGTLLEKQQTDLSGRMAKYDQAASQPVPAPKLQDAPEAPKMDIQQGATEWVSALNVLAALGGLKSRQGATTALNAFAAGMKGFKEGKMDAFKQAHQDWQDANEQVIEHNKALNEQYQAVLENKKLSMDEQMGEMRIIASQNSDALMEQATAAGNYFLAAKQVDMHNEAITKAHQAQQKLDQDAGQIVDRVDIVQKAIGNYQRQFMGPDGKPKPGAPPIGQFVAQAMQGAQQGGEEGNPFEQYMDGDKPKPGATINGYEVSSIARKAKAIAVGGMTRASQGLSTRQKNNQESKLVDAYIDHYYPDADVAGASLEYHGKLAGAGAGGRREMTTSQALGELDQLVPAARASLEKLKKSNYPDYNSLINSAAYKTGDPDIVEATNMVQEVANAYTAVLVRGGQRSDAAQAASDALLKTSFASPQWKRALDVMESNSQRIMKGIRQGSQNFLGGGNEQSGSGAASSDNADPLGIR